MRKIIAPLILIGSLAATSLAFAAPTVTEGTIKAIDMKAMTVTLDDGTLFHLPKGFKIASYKVGEKVKVTWETINEATALAAA